MTTQKQELQQAYQNIKGKAAPRSYTIARLKSELKRLRHVLAMVVRHVMDEMSMDNLSTDPTDKIQQRLQQYDIAPPRNMITGLAVRHYHRRRQPKKVRRRSAPESTQRKQTKRKRVRFQECRTATDCPPTRPACKNAVCVTEHRYTLS